MPVEVDVVEELGADAYIYGTRQHAGSRARRGAKPIIARVDGRRPRRRARRSTSDPDPGHMHVFDAETGQRLGD